ncbi:IS607 family transposase [Geminocystis sp. GBBB08]|uniref:IS607 family transposase n=1 Tax=Geminocystis sp. GBBB08 TaxID=2604140 RepID=UPI0027E218BC|nr:IS607 family transposase [Geminocystis sp. GBBB08]MBL1211342.1 IS607 family transposase [Geminocystis sp. GBBB08]
MEYAKLQIAAKQWKVHYRTILAWANQEKIKYITLPSGARQYELPAQTPINQTVVGYIRVSSHSQKQNLVTQRELLLHQYPNAEIISETASGLNFKRKKLWNIMERAITGDVGCVVVTHKDRLARFGFDFIEKLLERFGCKLVVLNKLHTSPEQELVQDILAIIHVFSSRLYGLRKYSNELKKLQNVTQSSSEETN